MTEMHKLNQLVQQHISEHESRLKHLDELMDRAHQALRKGNHPQDLAQQLATLKQERDKLSGHLETLRSKAPEDWRTEEIEQAGPMGVWDVLALQLEKLVERMEH